MIKKLSRFKEFIGPKVWRYLLISIALGLAWFGVESSFILILQGFLFSVGLLNEKQVLLPGWYPTSLEASVVLLILFGAVRAVVSMLRGYFAALTQVTFICEQRKGLLSYGLKNAGAVSSKSLIGIFTEITSQAGLIIYFISNLITTIIAAVLFFIMAFNIAPRETMIGVFLLSVVLYPLKFYTKRINNYGTQILKEWENISDSLVKGLRNFFFLSIYNQLENEIAKGELSLDNYQLNYARHSIVSGVVTALPVLAGVTILSLITYLSMTYLQTGGMKLVSFFYLFIRLAQSASDINGAFSNMRLHLPGFKDLYSWKVKIQNVVPEALPSLNLQGNNVEVEFENVGLSYDGEKFLFQDLSFKISKGDVLVIKGGSGAGKSSLLSLVLDINRPTTGEVLINGASTKNHKIDIHNVLGYVGPEPFLIAGSIKDNLLYGNNTVSYSSEDLREVLKKVALGDLVERLPKALEEHVNDIPQFSTGQKQRLAFARALLRNPKLVILDEATANLDIETEKKIISNLKDLFAGCTTIVVTHKDSFDSIATKTINLIQERN